MISRVALNKVIVQSLHSKLQIPRLRPLKQIPRTLLVSLTLLLPFPPIRAHQLSRQHSIYSFSTTSCAAMAEGEAKEPEWREYLGQEEAAEFDNALFFDYEFSIDQLMELAGLCVAQAVASVYPCAGPDRVLVVCGPGNNGGDGLAAARHLLMFGYEPVIFYPKRTSKEIYQLLVHQCEKLNISFIEELPSSADISRNYRIVLDAIFGFSFKGNVRPPFDQVLSTLGGVSVPIASVDIPSGWDVEKGNVSGEGLNPDLLISLTAPKLCAKLFTGQHHYLGLRIIPRELADKFRVKLPVYPGTDQIVRLK